MIRIYTKPRLACITRSDLYMLIGTYYNYPLTIGLKDMLSISKPEDVEKGAFFIFTEEKYLIPLNNYIKFYKIKSDIKFYEQRFWSTDGWDKFKALWRIMKQSIESKIVEDVYNSIFMNNFFFTHDDILYERKRIHKERVHLYFYFIKGFRLQSVYGTKTYRYHLGDPYFEVLKHPKNPDQTIERLPFYINSLVNIEESSENWFNTEQFKAMNKFMKIAEKIFDIDLSEEEDIIYE